MLEVSQVGEAVGGFTAVSTMSQTSFRVDQGEILGLIGPNGSGQRALRSSTCSPARWRQAQDRSCSMVRRSRGCRRTGSSTGGSAAPSRFRGHSAASPFSRTLRSPASTARAAIAASRPRRRPRRSLAMVGLPRPIAHASVDGLFLGARQGLKKLGTRESARHRAKTSACAMKDLGGLDEAEMGQAADMLRNDPRRARHYASSGSSTSWAC